MLESDDVAVVVLSPSLELPVCVLVPLECSVPLDVYVPRPSLPVAPDKVESDDDVCVNV